MELSQEWVGPVSAAVVDQDQLIRPARHLERSRQLVVELQEVGLFVVQGDDNRDLRWFSFLNDQETRSQETVETSDSIIGADRQLVNTTPIRSVA